jgi:L-rhamnose mutarotase
MIRKAFLIYAKKGMAEEYARRHDQIWPELKNLLKAGGVSNYSIFLHKASNQLFGYLEIEDEELYNKIGESEVCQRWWKYMTEVLVSENEQSVKANEDILTEVFHLD